jgi:hypothetical protein
MSPSGASRRVGTSIGGRLHEVPKRGGGPKGLAGGKHYTNKQKKGTKSLPGNYAQFQCHAE